LKLPSGSSSHNPSSRMTLRRRPAFPRSPFNAIPRFSTAVSHVNGGRITWRSLTASSKSAEVMDEARCTFDSCPVGIRSTWATGSAPSLLGYGCVFALSLTSSPFDPIYDWVDWVDWVDQESRFGPPGPYGPPSLLWM